MTKLTEQQTTLGNLIVAGKNPNDAMREAGYAPNMTFTGAMSPALWSRVRERTHEMLQALAPKAVMVAAQILDNDTTSDKVRLDAARLVLDRAGYVAPKAAEASTGATKALHEMTREELAERAARLNKEISERSIQVIDDTDSDTSEAQELTEPSPNTA